MTCLKEFYEEKNEKSHSKALLEGQLRLKKKFFYHLLTSTAIITGILIIITIYAIISGILTLSTIFVDILMILWHFILLIRIYSIEKDLDNKKLDKSEEIKHKENSNIDIDWI